jgi:hypothetical protein
MERGLVKDKNLENFFFLNLFLKKERVGERGTVGERENVTFFFNIFFRILLVVFLWFFPMFLTFMKNLLFYFILKLNSFGFGFFATQKMEQKV